jgi:hypothetical protein
MKKSTFISLFFLLLFVANRTKAQTFPLRSFVELKTATWSPPDIRGIVGINDYLAASPSNIGLQVKINSTGFNTTYNLIDSWGLLATGLYSVGSVPNWWCKRDVNSIQVVTTSGKDYCKNSNLFTHYNTGGIIVKKYNDSLFDVLSFFTSQKTESNVDFALGIAIVEDSIYADQKSNTGSSTQKVFHRNVLRGYAEISSGVMPSNLDAGKNYYFKTQIKAAPVADANKFKVIVVAMNKNNNSYLNAGGENEVLKSETPQICMVTADSLNKNNIIWKPLNKKGIVYLEKETNVTNKFIAIDSASSEKPRLFLDKNSNAAIKPEMYRLVFRDTTTISSGVAFKSSEVSSSHRTIHLSINKGTGNDWNLIWSPYQGFNVVSYDIMRKLGSGAWTKIASVSGNVYSYTDLNVSSTNVAYKISVISPVACDPNAWSIYASESNIADQNYLKNLLPKNASLSISPNPVSSILTINASHECGALKQFEILDISGRLVMNGRIRNFTDMVDVSSLKNGVYSIHCLTEQGSFTKQFVK